MDYLNELLTYGKTLLDNKWTVLFIVFGILVAYSMGKTLAKGNKIEDFETRCEKEKNLYDNNKPQIKEKYTNDEDEEDEDEDDDESEPVAKKIITIASASASNSNNKEDCPDLSNYIHKSLIPDLNGYLSKEYVKKNYISRETLKKNYMRKCDCVALSHKDEPIEELEEPPCDSMPISIPAASISIPTNKKEKVEDKQIQTYFDKNKDTMDASYSMLNDAFCNKRSCFINGFPNGLRPQ